MSTRSDIIADLIIAVEAVKDDSSYPIGISTIEEFDENVTGYDISDTPAILICDTGRDAVIVRDSSYYRRRTEIELRGFVKVGHKTNIHESLNKTQAFIEQFIDSNPDLGDNVLKIRLMESLQHRYDPDESGLAADVIILAQIDYVQAIGSP